MKHISCLLVFLSLSLWISTSASFAQSWGCQFNAGGGGGGQDTFNANTAGATGCQFRTSNTTTRQAQQGCVPNVGSFIAPVGTYELSHASVNRAALPYDGYTFGFGCGPSFPTGGPGQGCGLSNVLGDIGSGCWGSLPGDILGGSTISFGAGPVHGSIGFGCTFNTPGCGEQYIPPCQWGTSGPCSYVPTTPGSMLGAAVGQGIGGFVNGIFGGGCMGGGGMFGGGGGMFGGGGSFGGGGCTVFPGM